MALDPRIALGVQPMQLGDPMERYGKMAAIQGAQNQNALAQYQLGAAQRSDEQAQNRLRLFQEAGGDPTKVANALLQSGDTKGYTEFTKGEAEVGAKRAETISKHMELSKARLSDVRTPEDYIAWHKSNHADPVLAAYFSSMGINPQEQTQKIVQQLQQPGGFQALFTQSALGLDRAMEQVLTSQNLGGTTQVLSTPKYAMPGTTPTATVVPGSVQKITQSPDNAATVGASLANAAATREIAKATRDAAQIKSNQDTEMKLADDYRNQSKEFQQSKAAHEQLSSTLDSATKSPAATLAAATKFMKMLDPGSVVRESELGMALQSSGVFDRAQNYISTLSSGKKLTPTQVTDFKNISDQMFDAAKRVQQAIDADYTQKAKQYGLRPEMVTQNLGQNAKTVSFFDLK